MEVKRKAEEKDHNMPVKSKQIRPEKYDDLTDNEDLSDIDDGGEIFNGIHIPAELPSIISTKENVGSRMVIKNIVAYNFMSFYGKVTIGPFHKSLTSIVDVNGYGKRIVIDSLLFVFGYQSMKIQPKELSVFLHKSDEHNDVRECSITVNFVHIQDDSSQDNDFVSIPGTEITITRSAFKDNTSFYTLNNKRVKFKDVATILKKNGIDLIYNRFLILQDEIEQIAMMKPKAENEHSTGMLEYLEDIIGTVRYKKPIDKLDKKVKEVLLEKNEKVASLKFFAREREELIEPAKEIIRYLKRTNELTRLSNKRIQRLIFDENKIIKTKVETQNDIKNKISVIENKLQADSKKENDGGVLKSLSEKVQLDMKKKDDLEKRLKYFLDDNYQLKVDITMANDWIKKYENLIKQEQKKIINAQGVPKIKKVEYEKLKSQIEPLEEECIELEANYTKVNFSGFKKSENIREEKDLLAVEELKLLKIVGGKQNQFQTLKTKFEILLDDEKSEREKLSKFEEQLVKEVDEFQKNIRQKEKAESDINISKNTIKELERNIETLKNDEQQIKINLQNIQQSLMEKRTAYAETTEQSGPIQYILKLRDNKEICGILGRCGDYGQVEDKYDIAACTACESTDQIVVETTDAAHACIQKLRTNNMGRLTFSILPQVEKLKSRADANNKYPQNAKRVFDFIQILDQRFRTTFYSGLYDTLLAETLEKARKIAFDTETRYRVVTYKGDLIEQSGIMSGGGRPIKGKIGPQETMSICAGNDTTVVGQTEIEKLDKIAKDLEIKLMETQSKIFDFQGNIDQHCRQIEEPDMIIRLCSLRINAFKERENKIKKLIEAQKLVIVQKKTDPIAVANKVAEIKKAEKELEEAMVEYDKIKSKMNTIKKKIEDITEGEPKEAKRLLNEATKKLEKTRIGINQINVDIQAAERQIKKSDAQIKTLNDDINTFKEKKESFNERFKKNEDLFTGLKEKISKMSASIIEQKINLQEIENKTYENHHRNIELHKYKIQLSQNLDVITNELEKHLKKRDIFKTELNSLKLHIIPEMDIVRRDPVLESCQNRGLGSQNTAIMDKKNKKDNSEKNDNSVEKDNPKLNVENVNDIEDVTDVCTDVLPKYTSEQLETISIEYVDWKTALLTNHLEETPNFSILEEYKKRTKQYNEKADEVAKVLKIYNDFVNMLNTVHRRRRDEFMASFEKIKVSLKERYQMIIRGGDAELEFVDSLDPFSGVNFCVRPPKKTWKLISNLSGDEKTLSSLALVFALHYYKPSPLYVMDEIDTALGSINVSIIAYYIKERTKNSQFIIISSRLNMFEKANLLISFFNTNGCTKISLIKTNEYLGMQKKGNLAKYKEKIA